MSIPAEPLSVPRIRRREPYRTLTRAIRVAASVALACLLAIAGVIATAPPAQAAAQGVGFGAWAPTSQYGWHGSMLINGVHTYCILPGVPAPTGASIDNGLDGAAAGLSPQQLTGINLLVTRYGQTDDPMQAAAVGWAVKATANWNETLHHFGYRGDSLAGAIDWTFSALAPAENERVQQLAVAYYNEATSTPAGVASASGSLVFSMDAADSGLGSVRVEATTTAAVGSITLENATFTETGTTVMEAAVPGREYAVTAQPPAPGRPYFVSGGGRFSVTSVAAVRHFTTPGGQDTAGPTGEVSFDVAGADATPRVPLFAPTITTQVLSDHVVGAEFVDDVRFAGSLDHWPRGEDGAYLPLSATAEVYRTDDQPVLTDGVVPENAVPIGSLSLTTGPDDQPTSTHRVMSTWPLPGPGFYTAVWSIRRDQQVPEVAASLPIDYSWSEAFGEVSQIADVAAVPTKEEPTAAPPIATTPPIAALAATGLGTDSLRGTAGIAVSLLTVGTTLLAIVRRRRFVPSAPIG